MIAAQKRPVIYEELFEHPPLVVLNGFAAEGHKHLQLVQTVIQNMFPTIDVDIVNKLKKNKNINADYNNQSHKKGARMSISH